MAKYTRILSIDGGGIRGVIPGQVLVALEKKLGGPISDYFDLIAGTSTGGILTCALLAPGAAGRPKFTAAEAVGLYLERGDDIFHIPKRHRLRTLFGLRDEKFPEDEIEDALRDYFGDLWLSELRKPCLITSYDVKRRQTKFFTQHTAKHDHSKDFYVRDVARATSAAPTYFEVARAKSRTNIPYPLVDGGLFANNPALCAYAEVRNGYSKALGLAPSPTAKNMVIVSLGTGEVKKSYPYNSVKSWGLAQWVRPVLDIMMSAVSEVVDFQLRQIYDAVGAPEQYVRIDPALDPKLVSPDMDDASRENLIALKNLGRQTAEQCDGDLCRIADLLREGEPATTSTPTPVSTPATSPVAAPN